MNLFRRTFVLVMASLMFASPSSAQTPVDPSGHWEGVIQLPNVALDLQIDLAKDGNGELQGTMSSPGQYVNGLPLTKIARDGQVIVLQARNDQTFRCEVSPDGKQLSGNLILGGNAIPITLTRNGDARIAAEPRSSPVGKELEGIWNATLSAKGVQARMQLRIANRAGGTAAVRIISVDEGGLEIPAAVTQRGLEVTVKGSAIAMSFAGTLNAVATELAGTFTEGALVVPLVFHHASAGDK